MRFRTLAAGVLVGTAVALLLVAAGPGLDFPGPGAGDGLTALWLSDTARDVRGNHHEAVGADVNGTPVVFAPVSGSAHRHGGDGHGDAASNHDHADSGCGLVALEGRTGEVRWIHEVPPENCTIHSVADPTVSDVDGDGEAEVLATTTERAMTGFDAASGDREFRHPLSEYGYARPVAEDLTGDSRPELVVVDIKGSVHVVRPGGATVWTHAFDRFVWGQPLVADFDAEGGNEVVVGLGSGRVVQLSADGDVRWNVSASSGSVTWSTSAQLDRDPAREVVVATADGQVVALDGRDGSRQWRRDLGELAAVHAVGDGDGDGTPEVYATASDGFVRALSGPDGSVEWATNVTDGPVQMTPPPTMGDLDGDGDPELVVATNGGTVTVLSPVDGTTLASYERNVRVYARPTVADLDGDAGLEIVVMYGDGRVAALDYS